MEAQTVAFGICILLVCSAIGMQIRNQRVYRWGTDKINRIGDASKEDIYNGIIDTDRLQERWAAFDAVSYHEMVLKFWRPLDSWLTPELEAAMTPTPVLAPEEVEAKVIQFEHAMRRA